jgi:hypothetical protein
VRILWSGLILGFFLNLAGWLGNVFLLGSMWEAAFALVIFVPGAWLTHALMRNHVRGGAASAATTGRVAP